MRNGSFGSLNFSSMSSFTIRLRCVAMSSPFSRNSATSFCDCETTAAMSVFSMKLILSRIGSANFGSTSASSCRSNSIYSRHRFFTLSCIRTAVALLMHTTIALPMCPRPMKCRTMSSATFSNRSSRVIRWYSRANSRSSFFSCSASSSAASSNRSMSSFKSSLVNCNSGIRFS